MRSADHITDAFVTLHWLRVPQRIEYKVAVMTCKVLHGTVLRYLDHLHWSVTYLAGRHCALPTRVAFWCHLSDSQPTVAGLSPSLVPASGICFRRRLRQLSHCQHSASISRLSSSWSLILMSYSELKHCISQPYICLFSCSFSHFSLYLVSSSAIIGFPDWLIDW